MAANLVELSSRSDLKCVAEQPDIILLVRIVQKIILSFNRWFLSKSVIMHRSVACWSDFVALLVRQNLEHKELFMRWVIQY